IYKHTDDSGLPNLILKIAELLTTHELCKNEYNSIKVMILRIIYYSLKMMIFNIDNLIKLMKILENGYDVIFYNYEENFEKYKPTNSQLRHIPSILSYFTKILYLITIDYNDFIFFETYE